MRLDGVERVLSHMTSGSLVLRSQTVRPAACAALAVLPCQRSTLLRILMPVSVCAGVHVKVAKGRTPVLLSYRIRSSIHHQKIHNVAAAWKLVKNGGTPQCLLDNDAIALLQRLQNVFLPTLSAFLRQVAAHRHFLDADLSAICLRLELQYREFIICRSARHQLLVCTLDTDKSAVKSLVIRIDCTACQLVCREANGSECTITTLDEALSRLLGRDTSRDAAHATCSRVYSQRGDVQAPTPQDANDEVASPSELVARLRTATFEEDPFEVGSAADSMLSQLQRDSPAKRVAWLKDGALEVVSQ